MSNQPEPVLSCIIGIKPVCGKLPVWYYKVVASGYNYLLLINRMLHLYSISHICYNPVG
ncbi:hypothetical protein [Dysgonomonas termitidis]|uniref:Uncharacterized protein n=1 Tax=Dysgonomonas termitidis TaxID=1516126 RepID=A0ABV9KRP8_9BACT